jgi:spermidine synthase
LGTALIHQNRRAALDTVAASRDFYGTLRIAELRKERPDLRSYQMLNGSTDHGLQFQDSAKGTFPTTYYHPLSGVGLLLDHFTARPNRRIGVVGLGAGTLAAYGKAGDTFRFYELSPAVERMARHWFSYLKDSKATVDVVLGDARLSLEREPPQAFDVLVLDAFSSDSIPVHLLTREAFDTYAAHLKPDGVIAVHVSNRHLDLIPVVAADMAHLTMDMVYLYWTEDPMPFGFHSSRWLLMSHNRAFLQSEPIAARASRPDSPFADRLIAWTDDYASLLPIIKK